MPWGKLIKFVEVICVIFFSLVKTSIILSVVDCIEKSLNQTSVIETNLIKNETSVVMYCIVHTNYAYEFIDSTRTQRNIIQAISLRFSQIIIVICVLSS